MGALAAVLALETAGTGFFAGHHRAAKTRTAERTKTERFLFTGAPGGEGLFEGEQDTRNMTMAGQAVETRQLQQKWDGLAIRPTQIRQEYYDGI